MIPFALELSALLLSPLAILTYNPYAPVARDSAPSRKSNCFGYQLFCISLCSFLLTGCTAFAPVKPEIPVNYTLSSLLPASLTKAQKSKIVILVTTPQTSQIYNTTRMVYVDKPYQLNYFVKNRWADTPPQMLQQLIMQTLQNTQHYRAVIIPPAMTHYDFMLRTELLDLHQDFTQHPSQIYLTVRAQLINATSNQVTATKQFNIIETTPQDNPYGGVVAANQATVKLMQGLAMFCWQNLRNQKVLQVGMQLPYIQQQNLIEEQ